VADRGSAAAGFTSGQTRAKHRSRLPAEAHQTLFLEDLEWPDKQPAADRLLASVCLEWRRSPAFPSWRSERQASCSPLGTGTTPPLGPQSSRYRMRLSATPDFQMRRLGSRMLDGDCRRWRLPMPRFFPETSSPNGELASMEGATEASVRSLWLAHGTNAAVSTSQRWGITNGGCELEVATACGLVAVGRSLPRPQNFALSVPCELRLRRCTCWKQWLLDRPG